MAVGNTIHYEYSTNLPNPWNPSVGLSACQTLGIQALVYQPAKPLESSWKANPWNPSVGLPNPWNPSIGLPNPWNPRIGLPNPCYPSVDLTNLWNRSVGLPNPWNPSVGVSEKCKAITWNIIY